MSLSQEIAEHLWDIYTMEYDSAIKGNKLLMYIITSVNLKTIVLNEKSLTKKHIISSVWNSRKCEPVYKCRAAIFWGQWGKGRGRNHKEARESFQTDRYIHYLTVLTVAKVHMHVRLTASHTLYAWVLLHVNKKIKLQKKYLIWNVLKSWHKGNVNK